MKKIGLFIIGLTSILGVLGQTNATDFTVDDCSGTSHNLFTELDAGKIIVIGWTMPCSACASPLLSVHNAVLNFAVSNPGVVEYWLVDDFNDSPCSTIEDWCTNNGITNVTVFSSKSIKMLDYGSNGMPKVVVVACSDHKVYYNQNDNPTGSGVTNSINDALADIAGGDCQLTRVSELKVSNFGLECFPNPAASILNVSFQNSTKEDVTIELYDITGALLKVNMITESAGEVQYDISNLSIGTYLLKVVGSEKSETKRFNVSQ